MKILFVITKSNYGGAQRYVHELARALSAEHEILVAFGGTGLLKEKLVHDGIRTATIRSFGRDIRIGNDVNAVLELWNLYQIEQPDIVHLNSSKAGAIGSVVARLCGIERIIFTAHGWPFREKRNVLWRLFALIGSYVTILCSHRVIAVSKDDHAAVRFPLLRERVRTIHTAVPPISFLERDAARATLYPDQTQRDRHAKDRWLVTSAELTPNKNLFTAVDAVVAYNATHEQKIFYSVIGDGELRQELQAYIHEKGAMDHIKLLGYTDNARTFLRAFDVFLLPSLKEGMPYALLEAGAAGLPCLCSKVGGIPEVIEHEINGLFIDPNDSRTIVSALEKLLLDESLKNRFGAALRQKIEHAFSLADMIERTKRVYFIT